MSFFSNPIANISGGIRSLGKDVSNLTKNPIVDALAAVALDSMVPGLAETTGLGTQNQTQRTNQGNGTMDTGESKMAHSIKHAFVVTSAVNSKFGVFKPEQRLQQTIDTINSIKSKVEGGFKKRIFRQNERMRRF